MVDVGYAGSLGRHLSWQTGLDIVPLGAQFKPSNADPTNPSAPLTTAFLVPIVGYSSIGYNADAPIVQLPFAAVGGDSKVRQRRSVRIVVDVVEGDGLGRYRFCRG